MTEPETHRSCRNLAPTVEDINRKLREFINESLNAGRELEGASDMFMSAALTVHCWEALQCERLDCPAHGARNDRCWLRAGTLCGGDVQGDLASKLTSCLECDVLSQQCADPNSELYENVLILIHHLQDNAAKIRGLAVRDQLTGVYNRRYLDEVIPRECARAARHGTVVGLFVIDMDDFKRINDESGHAAGDEALVAVAELCQNTTRQSDFVFRTGGDEFLVLAADTSEASLPVVRDRLQDEVCRWNDENRERCGYSLSMSIGFSACGSARDLQSCLNEADARMYADKRRKRPC